MVKKMGWVTMVKRIKRAQKGLASTTSLRCYWSVRVNLYDLASVCSVLRCYLWRKMPKRMQRRDFSRCEESKRRKAIVEEQIDINLSTSSVEEDLVRVLYY